MLASVEVYQPTGKEVPFGAGRFLLSHRLGNGSFGDIFEGYDKHSRRIVAVKLERKKARYPQLSYESKVYRVLHQPPVGQSEVVARPPPSEGSTTTESNHTAPTVIHQTCATNYENGTVSTASVSQFHPVAAHPNIVIGIPQIYYFDSEGDYNIMVMEMCGPSLEDVFNYCHRRFSLKTVLMIADQLLHRIQYFHEKGFVHRDIKPENFVLGCRAKGHILYVIDYGLSKLYWEMKKNSHIPFAEGRPLTGTARYCSVNVHRGYEQSRRDDLESIGFLFIYFLQSTLPWQGIQAKDQQLKTIKIGEKKISTPLEELCKGLPKEFLKYCQYCRALTFTQKPDYEYLRRLFRGLGKRLGFTLPSFTDFSNSVRGAAEPSNPFSASHRMSMPDDSVVASHMPSTMSVDTGSKASHVDRSPRTVAAQLLTQSDDADPLLGPYDWEFDWISKRQMEVREGMDEQRRKHRVQTQQSLSSMRPADVGLKTSELKSEDVSDPDMFSPLEKISDRGSKRPLFRGTATGTETGLHIMASGSY
ncbi:putative casein kinase I [Leptomonas pyrrhocoris]|uniref:non-specific serine/threonine protein kinase n=1 Tax=Leptomonas pyrrhocoris TaxID=157538 RepID=A0A0M9G045_LEPPY|nr:putative casein kinase I [Leptomonas pyrrhocoris]KPA79645.1 putative casein kinase I [Leptomonas pyrrhocoris]|eukprot:XP_015658084.1 putative casein kinase I [Leptomonas pyrrhocoris]